MNPSERGMQQSEKGLTRRELFRRTAGLAAAALVFAGGCVEVELPQEVQPGTNPQATVEPQAQEPPILMSKEDAENLSGFVSLATISALLIFLAGRRRI